MPPSFDLFHELTKVFTFLFTIYMLFYASSSQLKRITSQDGGCRNLVCYHFCYPTIKFVLMKQFPNLFLLYFYIMGQYISQHIEIFWYSHFYIAPSDALALNILFMVFLSSSVWHSDIIKNYSHLFVWP